MKPVSTGEIARLLKHGNFVSAPGLSEELPGENLTQSALVKHQLIHKNEDSTHESYPVHGRGIGVLGILWINEHIGLSGNSVFT